MSLRARHADLEGEYRDLFAEHGIQCAVVRRDSRLFASLRQDGVMPLTFSDDDWAVFVR
jgi:hypothetical protein